MRENEFNKNKRFLDSFIDQSDFRDPLSGVSPGGNFDSLVEPQLGIGERQVPGQDGFRIADTPQAWVFICKKQWVDETWTYVVDDGPIEDILLDLEFAIQERTRLRQQQADQSEIISIETEIDRLNAEVEVERAKIEQVSGQLPSDGKLFQIDIRSALGNIITRKLDWMNEHEKFTKVPTATQNTFEALELERARQRVTNLLTDVAPMISEIDISIQTIEDSTAAATETLKNEQSKSSEEQDQDLIGGTTTLIALNEERLTELREQRSDLTAQLLLLDNDQLDEVDRVTALEYRPTTLSGNAFTRYYRSPIFKTKDTRRVKQIKERVVERTNEIENAVTRLIEGTRAPDGDLTQALTAADIREITTLQEEYLSLQRDLVRLEGTLQSEQTRAPIALESGISTFNGVVEFANIPSISTTVSLEGEGSASFTLESPQNIFHISREDIKLALSENPFLERTDGSTIDVDDNALFERGELVLYKGRAYPSYIVSLLQRSGGASVDVGHLTRFTAASVQARNLSRDKDALELEIQTKTIELEEKNALLENPVIPDQDKLTVSVDAANLQVEIENAKTALVQVQNEVGAARTKLERTTERLRKAEEVLHKYYLGKAIVEVLDRVFIWATSPSRTLYRLNRDELEEGRYAVEDPSAIAISQQLAVAQNRLTELERLIPPEIERLDAFTKQPLGTIDTELTFSVNPELIDVLGTPRVSETINTAEANQLLNRLLQIVPQQQRRVRFLQNQVKRTDVVTGAVTFDRIPDRKFIESDEEFRRTTGDYETRHLGLEEQRLQVFQGIVSSVKQTYADGKYTIQVSCKDNMSFLSMSRIMVKPALRRDREPQGILNDPIWRNNELAGTWKNGILVLDNVFINDEIKAKIDKKLAIQGNISPENPDNARSVKRTGETEGRQQIQPFVTSLPFARIDAANLVSFLVTGLPYNFELFIRNAVFGGRLNLTQKSGTTAQQSDSTSLFAKLKRDIGEQNDRLGDFEPYVDIGSGNFNEDTVNNRRDALEQQAERKEQTLREAYERFLFARLTAYFQRIRGVTNDQARDTKTRSVIQNVVQSFDADAVKDRLKAFDAWTATIGTPALGRNDITKQLTDLVVNAAKELRPWQNTKQPQISDVEGEIKVSEEGLQKLLDDTRAASSSYEKGGIFSLIFQIAEAQAQKSQDIKQQQGRDLGAKPPTSDPNATKAKATENALRKFFTTLLRMEGTFREPFVQFANVSGELAGFIQIQDTLKEFVNDLVRANPNLDQDQPDPEAQLKRRFSLVGQALQGATSTIEDIVRKEKRNLLVISSDYTLDLNLQAYHTEVGQGNFALFQSEYETPISICKRAADQVDFEFFADENGHLQFKPPTYNRLLREHFDAVSNNDSVVRDAILVRFGDQDGVVLQALIRASCTLNKALVEFTNKRTVALGDLEKARNSKVKIRAKTQEQIAEEIVSPALLPTAQPNPFVLQNLEVATDAEIQQRISEQDIALGRDVKPIEANINAEIQAQELVRALRGKESQTRLALQIQNLATQQEANLTSDSILLIDAAIEENAKLVALFNKIVLQLRNILESLANTQNQTRDAAQSFVKSLDSFFDEHRIHRVFDHDLIGYNFTEAPPRFTFLEITGEPELARLPNEFYWAGGVDYDNWRHYGFLSESIQKAYFHSGSAAKTYCRALLGRERGRIFSGDISVRGDAKYRVGDCVFIESTGMYYYITSVSHNLSYGQSYTTQMTLAYGRRIDEIIPHPFDVLGNIMIDAYQSDLEQLLARQTFANLESQTQNTFAQNIGLDVAG